MHARIPAALPLYDIADAARYFSCSRRTVERLTDMGRLYADELQGGRRVYTRAELDRYAAAHELPLVRNPDATTAYRLYNPHGFPSTAKDARHAPTRRRAPATDTRATG
jgi:excisionase family DNA binding protein